jgi:glutamine synthetase
VLADATDSRGRLLEHAPRQMLRRQADRLAVLGLSLRIAVETRLQLTWARSGEAGGRDAGAEPAAPILEEFLVNASSQLLQAGLPVEILAKTGNELGLNPQQVSVTFRPAGIMAACDAVVLAHEAINVLAHNAGLTVSPAQQRGHDVTTLRLRLSQAPDNRLEAVGTPPEPHSNAVVTRTAHAALVEGLPELALVCSLAGRSGGWPGTSARENSHVVIQTLAKERGRDAALDIEVPTPDSPHAVAAAIAAVIAYGIETQPPSARLPALQSMPLPDTALLAYDLLGSSQRARTILGSRAVDHFVRAAFP